MTLNDAKDLVEISTATRLSALQKQMIWESANFQLVTEQFAKLAQTTQILLRFFHGVGDDVEKVWRSDPARKRLAKEAQEAYDTARAALGPVAMIKPSDIFDATDGQPAGQVGNAPCCEEHGTAAPQGCGCNHPEGG
jgi:hypothetical protein